MRHVVRVDHVRHSFGDDVVLDDVTFELTPGSLTGLIGPSGGGKSLLLKIMAGIRPPQSGTVRRDGDEASFMFQEGALFDSLSVQDNVAFPLVDGKVPLGRLRKKVREEVAAKADDMLRRVGLGGAGAKLPGELSGGMRRRASLARALVTSPDVALLDDPTAGLDPVVSSVIMELIVRLHDETEATTLVVSHDLRRLLPVVDGVFALFGGKIVYAGPVEGIFDGRAPEAVRRFVECRYDVKGGASAPARPA